MLNVVGLKMDLAAGFASNGYGAQSPLLAPDLSMPQNGRKMLRRCKWMAVVAVACSARAPVRTVATLPPEPRVEVYREPPPGRVERLPPQPRSDAVWIDGVWNWIDRRWEWTKGSWVIVPPGASYHSWAVTRGSDAKLYFSPAAWRDAHGNVISAPPPLATATITTTPVINYDGTAARTVTKQE